MTKEQRNKIITHLLSCYDWIKKWKTNGIIDNDTRSRLLLGNDKIPVDFDGECSSVNERLVNQMLLEMFIQSVHQHPLGEELPPFEPADDDLPRLDTCDRNDFVRMIYGTNGRILKLSRFGGHYLVDNKYVIADRGKVFSWNDEKEKPIRLLPGQTVSALDCELLKMARELFKDLKNTCDHTVLTKDGILYVSLKQAFKMFTKRSWRS